MTFLAPVAMAAGVVGALAVIHNQAGELGWAQPLLAVAGSPPPSRSASLTRARVRAIVVVAVLGVLLIGHPLHRGARGRRGARREVISRAYNHLLHATLRARYSDAQCGFKAARADAARALLPAVRDDGWFFDTELLTAAQRRGMRMHEVPVDWVEDPDSRVDVLATAWADLRGLARLVAAGPVARFAASASRRPSPTP